MHLSDILYLSPNLWMWTKMETIMNNLANTTILGGFKIIHLGVLEAEFPL